MITCSPLARIALALSLGLVAGTLRASESQAILLCDSVRLHPATTEQLGAEYRLEVTTAVDGTINDEIGVADEGPFLHGTTLVFTDPNSFPLWVFCGVEVPDPPDSNWNGISDFFEVDRAVTDIVSVGEFEFDDGTDVFYGTLDLLWNREAGSASGTCQIRLQTEDLGIDLTFLHTFEIDDYRGTLTYTVEDDGVRAQLSLARRGGTETLSGPITFTRIDVYELLYDEFTLTNALDQGIEFLSSIDTEITLLRGALRTNYFTVLITFDGRPGTASDEEYEIWELHLFDPNDGDADGVPDFSDDPLPPAPPGLDIRFAHPTVQLEIKAPVGQSVVLEQTSALAPPAWTEVQTLTLSTPTHTVELPAPTGPTYWRVRVD